MHNAGVAMLPADIDWDKVVNLTGDTSWEARKMRRYFVEIEKNDYLPPGDPTHGYNGM